MRQRFQFVVGSAARGSNRCVAWAEQRSTGCEQGVHHPIRLLIRALPSEGAHLLALLDCARSFGIVTIRGSVVDDFHKSAADRVHVSLLWECSPCAGLTRIVVHGSHLGCYLRHTINSLVAANHDVAHKFNISVAQTGVAATCLASGSCGGTFVH